MLVAVFVEMHASVYFYFWNFHECIIFFCHYLCHAILGKCTCIFLFLIYEYRICGNLNFENNMWDMGKGTYLVVEGSGNGKTYAAAAS